MIGVLTPQYIPLALVPVRRSQARTYVVPICGECGTAAGSGIARQCDRAVCGLLDRQHHSEADAA